MLRIIGIDFRGLHLSKNQVDVKVILMFML